MGYVTVEVELDHGHLVSKGSEPLPEKAVGLFTILTPSATPSSSEQKPEPSIRPLGLAKGLFAVPDDFNAALPDDVVAAWEGK